MIDQVTELAQNQAKTIISPQAPARATRDLPEVPQPELAGPTMLIEGLTWRHVHDIPCRGGCGRRVPMIVALGEGPPTDRYPGGRYQGRDVIGSATDRCASCRARVDSRRQDGRPPQVIDRGVRQDILAAAIAAQRATGTQLGQLAAEVLESGAGPNPGPWTSRAVLQSVPFAEQFASVIDGLGGTQSPVGALFEVGKITLVGDGPYVPIPTILGLVDRLAKGDLGVLAEADDAPDQVVAFDPSRRSYGQQNAASISAGDGPVRGRYAVPGAGPTMYTTPTDADYADLVIDVATFLSAGGSETVVSTRRDMPMGPKVHSKLTTSPVDLAGPEN